MRPFRLLAIVNDVCPEDLGVPSVPVMVLVRLLLLLLLLPFVNFLLWIDVDVILVQGIVLVVQQVKCLVL